MDLSTLDPSTVAALIGGILVPFVTALLVKYHAPSNVKATVAGVLTALAGVIPTVAYSSDVGIGGYLMNILVALATSQGLHALGVHKPVERATGDSSPIGKADPAKLAEDANKQALDALAQLGAAEGRDPVSIGFGKAKADIEAIAGATPTPEATLASRGVLPEPDVDVKGLTLPYPGHPGDVGDDSQLEAVE